MIGMSGYAPAMSSLFSCARLRGLTGHHTLRRRKLSRRGDMHVGIGTDANVPRRASLPLRLEPRFGAEPDDARIEREDIGEIADFIRAGEGIGDRRAVKDILQI